MSAIGTLFDNRLIRSPQNTCHMVLKMAATRTGQGDDRVIGIAEQSMQRDLAVSSRFPSAERIDIRRQVKLVVTAPKASEVRKALLNQLYEFVELSIRLLGIAHRIPLGC